MYAKQLSEQAAINFAYALQQAIKVPLKTRANQEPTPGSRETFHSVTLTSGDQIKEQVESSAKQIAAGIRADMPNGVQFTRQDKYSLTRRFPDHFISRSEVMGVYVAAMVRPIAGVGAQLTLVTEFDEWQPKQS